MSDEQDRATSVFQGGEGLCLDLVITINVIINFCNKNLQDSCQQKTTLLRLLEFC